MEFLLNRYRNLTVLVIAILAQLVLLAYQVKSNQDVRLIRVWAVTAVTPLARVLEVVRAHTIGVVEDYFVLINVREQNRKLSGEIGRLKLENQFLRSELQTADRVKALRAFQARTPSRTLAARIIGNATGTSARVVLVDRGSTGGVMRGMAVVTPDGIVGKVLAAYPTASMVQLITDPTFAAGVISARNRVHGTVRGQGQSKCLVDYVQNEERVDVGEVFYTSGDDRVFPKGMPVGTATVVREGSKGFKEIYLVPSGFQKGVEEVLIVLEGVHQQLPEPDATAASGVYLLPPPPAQGVQQPTSESQSGVALVTDADKLKERYKRIGEAQGHTFGEGAPGSKPPDFNINPNDPRYAARPQQGAASAAAQPDAAAEAAGRPREPTAQAPRSQTGATPPASSTAQPKPVQPGAVKTPAPLGAPQLGSSPPGAAKPVQSGAPVPTPSLQGPSGTRAGDQAASPAKPKPEAGARAAGQDSAAQPGSSPPMRTSPGAAKPTQPGAPAPKPRSGSDPSPSPPVKSKPDLSRQATGAPAPPGAR
ncbi:MAG: hypothetical protein HYZ57_01110 [Acidobacteria bacterium]|nr:hypothetical protein [Acidobacteriota bacterium]